LPKAPCKMPIQPPMNNKDINPITPGPRKKDLKRRAAKPRLSGHKKRSIWFQARSAWPLREAPIHTLVLERNRAKRDLPVAKRAARWRCIGPTNIGGRVTCVVCDPRDPNRIWAGAAGGGVWQSNNAGVQWRSLWKKQDSLNIGSLAIDPANPDVIYCGTGEANLSADSYAGVGIYKTANGGRTWQLLASASDLRIPTRIGVMAIDPFDSAHLVVGGVGAYESSPRPDDFGGIFVSQDGGVTWRRETFISTKNYWCHAIVFHPAKPGVIFATFTEQGAKSGIWLSEDAGEHWRQLNKGLPDPENFGRTSLAISPSNPDVIYVFAQDSSSDGLLGVFRSADEGATWREIGGRHFQAEGQISYGNTIAVHPKRPNHVLCGGVDLHLTTDGGKTWTNVTPLARDLPLEDSVDDEVLDPRRKVVPATLNALSNEKVPQPEVHLAAEDGQGDHEKDRCRVRIEDAQGHALARKARFPLQSAGVTSALLAPVAGRGFSNGCTIPLGSWFRILVINVLIADSP